ncbi:MAG: 16S rRNA (guanine(527)-N(7))-methyltransferase RsmG [Sphingomicrobium sp.]
MASLKDAVGRDVSRETVAKLESYSSLLRDESHRQNLISKSTIDTLWERHVLDSAQLARFAPASAKWVDLGSGAGLPGVVIAIVTTGAVTMVEPRRLRADFLSKVVADLKLEAEVWCGKAERIEGKFDVITARALAPLEKLLRMAQHLSHPDTVWILPRGRNAKSELAEVDRSWHYDLRAERSITDPDSEILLLSKVRAKSKR